MGKSVIKAENLRTVVAAGITGAYAAVGSAFSNPISILHIVNDTDESVYFSDDGTNNKIYIRSGEDLRLDVTNEDANPDFIAKGTQYYVKEGASTPTTGLVSIAAFYKNN